MMEKSKVIRDKMSIDIIKINKTTAVIIRTAIVCLLWWIVVLIGINSLIKYALRYDPLLDPSFVATVGTIIVAAALVTTNIILLAITLLYTDQTAKMAAETARMVEQNEEQWKLNLRPLFIPLHTRYDGRGHPIYRFANFRGLALFVTCSTSRVAGEEIKKEEKKVDRGEEISLNPGRYLIPEKTEDSDDLALYIKIDFQDTLAIKYQQAFKFITRNGHWDFEFNEACLPQTIDLVL